MRVLIYGLGGVGGYIAAYLCQTNNEIVGVARGEHLAAIKENGLQVIEDDKEFTVDFDAVDEKELSGYFDVVLFCVKSYDLEEAALVCKPYLNEESIVLSLSNGVEHGDTLRRLLHVRVLDGCIYILSHIQKAGVIRRAGNVFATIFAGDGSAILASLFEDAKLRYKIAEDIQNALWKKYIFISTFGVLTSYYDMPIRSVFENHYDETKEFLKEVCLVAKAKNIDIEDEVERSLHTASKLPQSASTSMHKDIKAKKSDELETLCGYLIREAKSLHVSVPAIQSYYDGLLKVHH